MDGKLNIQELILLVVDRSAEGIKGKTLLQKRVYFLSIMMREKLGYRAHYYGPFSPLVENGLDRLKEMGFVEEETNSFGGNDGIGFEVKRYDYRTTEDGKQIIERLREKHPKQYKKINRILGNLEKAGDDGDYVSLSVAAKTFFILDQEHDALTVGEIRSTAKKLGWDISNMKIDRAVSFLRKLNLVES